MIEYSCQYAHPIDFLNQKVVLCNRKLCEDNHRHTIYVDGEPSHICLADGFIRMKESALVRKVNIPSLSQRSL